MMEQQTFDFTRGDQLGLLDALVVPSVPGVKGATAKTVLRVIDGFGARCWASAALMATRCDLSERQIVRATSHLEKLGLIVVPTDNGRKQKNRDGSVTKTRLIDWTLIASRVRSQSLVTSHQPSGIKQADTMSPCYPRKQSDMVSEQSDMVSEQSDMVSEQSDTVSPNTKESQEPPPTASPPGLVIGGGGGSWKHVETRLRDVGLDRVASTIAIAQERRLVPDQVLALINQFESHRSRFRTPGALVDRIRSGDWCQPIPTDAQRSQVSQQTQAKREQQARERIRFQIGREWQAAKIWHTKTTEQIESEIDRRLSLTRQPSITSPINQEAL
jgi:hypothetical protein